MSTKNKVLLFITLSLTVFMLVLIGNIYLTKKEDLQQEEQQYKTNIITVYQKILQNYETFYRSRLEGILLTPGVLDAIKNQDRKQLYDLVEKRWEILKKENSDVKIMHFHKANGFTLLRMHNPGKYDDDIAAKRVMCRYIHEHKTPISGFEAGIHLLGYRVMIPIFYGKNKDYIGAVEIGTKPNFILNQMKNFYNLSGLIFSKQAEIFNKALEDKSKLQIENYRLDSNSLTDKDLINFLPEDYKLDKDLVIKKDGKVYAVYLFNHTDFKGERSAKTLIFHDITFIYTHSNEAVFQIIFFAILLYLILILTIKFGFEILLNKIDVTNQELQKNIAFLKSYQQALNESNIVTKADLKGNITYANENFYNITGYTKEETIGKPHNLVRHPDSSKEIFRDLWDTIKSKKVWKGVLKNRGKLTDYWVDITVLPILDEKNNIAEYIAVRHDITKMIHQQQRLDNAANTDILTGFGNRYKLNNDIQESKNPSLAILNIDNFSQVNDFYGHAQGDKIIKKVGKILHKLIKNKKYELYHLQGDEYVLFAKDEEKENFTHTITELSAAFSTTPITVNDDELYLNLTSAISFEKHGQLLTTADMALKVAKKENKEIVVYSDFISLNDEYENNIKWAKKIKTALETDNIVPIYQPIVNNETGTWEKFESLVRLRDDDGKLISPYFFLDISKKTKQYSRITQTMIEQTFEKFKERDEEFSINLKVTDNPSPDSTDAKTVGFDIVGKIFKGEAVVTGG